jgi:hypothetical protein
MIFQGSFSRIARLPMFTIYAASTEDWIYVGGEYLSALAEGIEAKPVDSGENVVVLIPDDDGVFHMANAGYVGEHQPGANLGRRLSLRRTRAGSSRGAAGTEAQAGTETRIVINPEPRHRDEYVFRQSEAARRRGG